MTKHNLYICSFKEAIYDKIAKMQNLDDDSHYDRTGMWDEFYHVSSGIQFRCCRVKNFYKLEKNSLDMVMIGASTAFTDYSAPLAFQEFGYTSYSLGTNAAPMGIAKSMLIEVLKTQNPKVILIDINGILYNDDFETREGPFEIMD